MSPCNHVKLPGGSTAIVCTRTKSRKCHYCGAKANLLCDWPMPGGGTCDLPICPQCSYPSGPFTDFCKVHTT